MKKTITKSKSVYHKLILSSMLVLSVILNVNGQTYTLGAWAGTTTVQTVTNTGGSVLTCNAPAGYVVVGYTGNEGAFMDQFQLVYAPLNANGTLGTSLTTGCTNGSSGGGSYLGQYEFTSPTAFVGGYLRGGDNLDAVTGYGKDVTTINTLTANGTGYSTLTLLGNGGGGNDLGDVFVPDGNVVIGMNFQITNGLYAGALGWNYAPIIGPPIISTFTPGNGCASTDAVIITGTNFTGATAVTIGGTPVLSYTVNSNTQITAVVGTGTTGTIAVTTANGTGTSAGTFTVNPLPVISSATASPTAICAGDFTNLNATSAGNFINWWTASTGGTLLTAVSSGANYSVNPSGTTTYYAEAVSLLGGGAVPAGYCSPTLYPTNGCNYITSVSTSGGVTNFTNNSNQYDGTGFTFFPSSVVAQLPGGSFTLTCQAQGYCSIAYYNVWVDWNRDGDFDDAGEAVVVANTNNSANNVTNFTISIPAGASAGNTRMRVLADGNGNNPITACDDFSSNYSEVEDYVINVIGGTGCVSATRTAVTVTVNNLPTVTANPSAALICMGDMETLNGGGATSYTWDNSVMDGVAFMPAGTLTYNVTGTDGNGCMNTASTTVTVNPLPTVTASASAFSICMGDMETLNGGGATSYTWDNSVTNGVPFVPTGTMTYVVTGTDGNGCMNTASIMVTANPLPTLTANALPTSICVGDSTTFSVSSAGNTVNLWDAASGGNLITTSSSGTVNYTMAPPAGTTTYYAEAVQPYSGSLPSGYCSPTLYPTNGCNYITSVSTTGGVADFTNNSNQYDGTGYTFFPASIVSQLPGGSFTLNCQAQGYCSIAYYNVWVDWNGDGDFDDAGEAVLVANTNNSANNLSSFLITVPVGATPGNTRMRVLADGNSNNPVTACDDFSSNYSEVEDYVVNIIGGAGCTSSPRTAVTVTVNNLPAVTANPSAASICMGDMETLSGGGATSYVWDNSVMDGVAFAPAIGTVTYSVIGTDGNGCVDTASTSVTVNALPTVSYTETMNIVCSDLAAFTLTAGSPINGTYTGAGVTGNMFDPGTAGLGTYTITYSYTDGNSCMASATSSITVDDCTGIQNLNAASAFSVYPNPNNGTFTITASSEGVYSIVNELGQTIKSVQLTAANNYSMNVTDVNNGIYFIIGTNNNTVVRQKIVVAK